MTLSRLRTGFLKWFLGFKLGRFAMRIGIRLLIPRHRIGVNVVCFDPENRILMLKHLFHPLSPWGLPGGWMDRGETPAECAMRELREETGITSAVPGDAILFFRNPFPDHLNIIILAQIESQKPQVKIDGVEITDSMWVTPETVPDTLSKHTYLGLKNAWATKNIQFDFPNSHVTISSY